MKLIHKFTSDEKKAFWGYGEWCEEPDSALFEHAGFSCEIARMYVLDGDHIFGGHLCGYVGIPLNHPAANKEWGELDLDCHGGQTYGEERKDGLYWIGFDCAHAWDLMPGTEILKKTIWKDFYLHPNRAFGFQLVYRNFEFVTNECKKLADQLKELS